MIFALPSHALSIVRPADTQAYRYCTASIATSPRDAARFAQRWLAKSPDNHAAMHCSAMAMFQLRNYNAAARTLSDILNNTPNNAYTERHMLTLQLAKSLRLANKTYQAIPYLDELLYIALNAASTSRNSTVTDEVIAILLERSMAYQHIKSLASAVNDLDFALTLGKQYHAVMLQRAKTFAAFGHYDSALMDVRTILRSNPGNKDALALQTTLNRLTKQ